MRNTHTEAPATSSVNINLAGTNHAGRGGLSAAAAFAAQRGDIDASLVAPLHALETRAAGDSVPLLISGGVTAVPNVRSPPNSAVVDAGRRKPPNLGLLLVRTFGSVATRPSKRKGPPSAGRAQPPA